ncbi:MAG: M16 family metallopeptidase, partial [Bryobacteraceae bacterium]
ETLLGAAFRRHTYKHNVIGLLKDIEDMPNQYQYSLQFFERYYRPEYTTILVAGDVTRAEVRALVDRHWGKWQRGKYRPDVPVEPPQEEPRTAHIDWPSPTLPWVMVGHRAPAYSDQETEWAALDLLSGLAFAESSELFQRLVIREQKVDQLSGGIETRVDPFLHTVSARIKNPADVKYVRDQILATLEKFTDKPVETADLDRVKSNARYRFALSLVDNYAIAAALADFISLRRTPESLNRLYEMYERVTPEDVLRAARSTFVAKSRTIVTLTGASKGAGQ